MLGESENQSPRVKIEDLGPYAKKNCKKCFGRGWRQCVKNVGEKKWVIDHYDMCTCVLKNKKLPELFERVKKADAEAKEKEQMEKAIHSSSCDHIHTEGCHHEELKEINNVQPAITPEISKSENNC